MSKSYGLFYKNRLDFDDLLYLRTTESGPPKGQVDVQNSLQEWTEIEALDGKCETGIKISTDKCSYSAAPRKYTRSFVPLVFVHLVCLHEVDDSALTDHTTPTTLQPHN